MSQDEKYMLRCIELAKKGLGNVSPNPMVGCIIVYNNKIIGEGYHMQFGEAHAEVNAINSVVDKSLLKHSTMYVNLEPCSHFGKTPPCADLIVKNGIKKIVIGSEDINDLVKGKGIKKLKEARCEVITGVLQEKCDELNKRFFTYHKKKRPYVILKWAQTNDNFIDRIRTDEDYCPAQISDKFHRVLSHKWRSEEQSIMIGTNTALLDNPELSTRYWAGKNPIRIVIDKNLRLPQYLKLFDKTIKTIVFTEKEYFSPIDNLFYIQIKFNSELAKNLLDELYTLKIQSVIIEGGTMLLNSFIDNKLWDEARIFTSNFNFNQGIKAPKLKGILLKYEIINNCKHELYLCKI